MRGVDCAVPNCGHLHATDDETLTQDVLRHAQQEHPDAGFTEEMARDFVRANAFDDSEHAQAMG